MRSFNAITRIALSVIAIVLALVSAATAEEWQALKLRGGVFAFVNDAWVQLARGDIVPDERIIRTAPDGRVQFLRGEETIDLGPNTQIRIYDREGQQFTVVQQHFGDVAIEAEKRNVQHFAVQTKYLAAVVKGTRFSVTAGANGAAVSVTRGQVQVRDVANKLMTEVTPGQSANVGNQSSLSVSGAGQHAPIVQFAGNALAADVETLGAVATTEVKGVTVTVDAATPAALPGNVVNTPAASVVANTPAAAKKAAAAAAAATTTTTTTAVETVVDTTVGTPAVSNVINTPAASVVANTPAATNTPPAHSNAGGKNK